MENHRRARIAYYTINDPMDKRSWSGLTYFIGQTLQKNIGDVHFLGPVKIPWLLDKTFRGIQKFTRFVFKTEYIPKYSFLKNFYASRVLKKKMRGRQYDFLFAPAAASELACLDTNLPIIYYGDATYKLYSETYEKEFRNLNSVSRLEGELLERRALKKSDLIIFSSHWAAKSAIDDYGVPANKIEIIQMGANIDNVPERDIIFRKEENKSLTLLFLSVDWERKGGSIAFEALQHLHNTGMDVKLIVCGCIPPPEFVHERMEVIPFLNKNKAEDFQRFVNLLSSIHFLLLPTRADCTPLVNCESNAYGVPAITTDVGGISEAVKDGINGYCLSIKAGGAEYANLIKELFLDKPRYHQLIETSRKRFEDELNWEKFTADLNIALQKHNIRPGQAN